MIKESHIRSAIKAISWRFLATVTTMLLVYIFIGTFKIALTIGGLEVVLKILIYFLHERVWDEIRFGRKEISPFVLWFTGLPSSGKTTLANAIYEILSKNGNKVERLDGDKVRRIFPATGFSKEQRDIHIQRVGFLASILEKNGIIVIASFISPYQESRDFVRNLCRNFIEVYMATPLEDCEKLDTKGLYKKAKKGEIGHFTGIDDPYEVPNKAELSINAANESVEKSAEKSMAYLKGRKFLS